MKLTNQQLYKFGKTNAEGTSFLKSKLGYIKDFDLQVCLNENDKKLKEGIKILYDSMLQTFGEKIMVNDPKVIEIMQKESTVELSKISITTDQMRGWQPDGDTLEGLFLIKSDEKVNIKKNK